MTEKDKVVVARVVCEKCLNTTFKLFRREDDQRNYFLICEKCGKTKEFRVFLIWDAEVDMVKLPKEVLGLVRPITYEKERCEWLTIESNYKCLHKGKCPYLNNKNISCPLKERIEQDEMSSM